MGTEEKKRHWPPGMKEHPGRTDVRQNQEKKKFSEKQAAIHRKEPSEKKPKT